MLRRRTVVQFGVMLLAIVGVAYDGVRTERSAAAGPAPTTSTTVNRIPGWAKTSKPRPPVVTTVTPPPMKPCIAAQYAKLEATMNGLRGSLSDDAFQTRWAEEKAKLFSPAALEPLGCAL